MNNFKDGLLIANIFVMLVLITSNAGAYQRRDVHAVQALAAGETRETVYTLAPEGLYETTSERSVVFGTIDLDVESNLHIDSMWVMQNNAPEPLGVQATLEMDGRLYPVYSDNIPFTTSGIGYTIARNHFIPNVPAGKHTLGVRLRQHIFQSGDPIGLMGAHWVAAGAETGSVMWVTAVPTCAQVQSGEYCSTVSSEQSTIFVPDVKQTSP